MAEFSVYRGLSAFQSSQPFHSKYIQFMLDIYVYLPIYYSLGNAHFNATLLPNFFNLS